MSDPVGIYGPEQDWNEPPSYFVERSEARQMKKRGEGSFINSGKAFRLAVKQPSDQSEAPGRSPENDKPFAGSIRKTAITNNEMLINAGLNPGRQDISYKHRAAVRRKIRNWNKCGLRGDVVENIKEQKIKEQYGRV